jgi:hypothetical protein
MRWGKRLAGLEPRIGRGDLEQKKTMGTKEIVELRMGLARRSPVLRILKHRETEGTEGMRNHGWTPVYTDFFHVNLRAIRRNGGLVT